MDSTSASLLRRLQQPNEQAAWQRFVDLYAPLIFHWARNHGLNRPDAADLTQDVLATLVDKLREFQYDPNRRFRGWLRTITINRANDVHRSNATQPSSGHEEAIQNISVTSEDLLQETEYRRFLIRRAMELMQAEFLEHAWKACWLTVVEGRSGADVARELQISESSVYTSKSRIMKRLRDELAGLIE